MKWLQKFMQGRYGTDQLSLFLLVLYLIITIVATGFNLPIISYISLALVLWCWFRIFSKNKYKRSGENTKFLRMVYPITSRVHTKRKEWKERKTYRFYTCPNCKQRLRVPRGRGTLTITCPKCKTKFDKRT